MYKRPIVTLVGNGDSITLDGLGDGFTLKPGSTGLGLAPVESTRAPLASGGALTRHRRDLERDIVLPVDVWAPTYGELEVMRRRLENLCAADVVEIRVESAVLGVRSAFAEYEGGLEGEFAWATGRTGQTVALTFSCPDPWWYGVPREVATRINALRKPLVLSEAVEATRRNLFPNPGMEYGRQGFTSSSIVSLSNDAFSGSSALKVEGLGGTPTVWMPWTAVAAGSVLAAGAQVKVSPGVTHVRVLFTEGSGNWSTTLGTEAFIPVSGAWTRITHTAPAASGQPVKVLFSLHREDAGSFVKPDPGEWAVFDEFILEESAEVGEFFDGDTPDTQSVRHEWEGAPGQSPSVRVYTGETPPTPFFPVVLSDSTIQGAHVLEVHGDAEVWPTWTIDGPGEDLLIQNDVTGERIFISGDFGEQVTVVTRPQEQDIFSMFSDRGGLWDRVSLDSVLFPLQPGENRVRMSMVNAKPSSAVTLSYRERYRAGH